MGLRERRAAVAAVDEACPRCAAVRGAYQEYCIECGLRLPPVHGRLASFRRGWVRRVGWYPGDWVWISLLALVGAAAGTAVAIAVTTQTSGGGSTTVVLPGPAPAAAAARVRRSGATTRTGASPVAPEPSVTVTTPGSSGSQPKGPPNGRLTWPSGTRGWTIVLVSYPTHGGRGEPRATAVRAAGLGLPQVGVLESSQFGSLHPGYFVVFSGRYSSRADAEAALTSARASGFGGAYTRQISR